MGMGNNQIREMADALWEYTLNKHLKSYLSDSVCYYRATVTTAPAGGSIGVTRPYEDEIFLPYAGSAEDLAVNDQCIVFVFGDTSNAIVIGDGTLSTFGSGGGGGGGGTFTPVTGKPTTNQTPAFGGAVTISQIAQNSSGQISATDRTITIPSAAATTTTAGLMSASDKTKLEGIAAADTAPLMDGTAAIGSSTKYARQDHVHPADTNKQAKIYTDSVTTTTTWTGAGPYTQTVTLASYTPTSNSKVDIQPDASAIAQLIADGVTGLYISNTSGTLTMYAIGSAPTAAMTLQVTITEVTAA